MNRHVEMKRHYLALCTNALATMTGAAQLGSLLHAVALKAPKQIANGCSETASLGRRQADNTHAPLFSIRRLALQRRDDGRAFVHDRLLAGSERPHRLFAVKCVGN